MVAERSLTATTTSSGSGFPIGAWTTYTSQNEPSDSLYGVLGVPRDASRDEIDNAFLRYRYRDSSGEFETLKPVNMDRVEYAYTVLSNPHKRDLYNQFGEETLRMIEHRYPLVAADMLGLHIAALVSTIVTCFLVSLMIIQVLVIGLKLDNTITSSWAVTFVPLWINGVTLALTIAGFGYFRYQRHLQNKHHDTAPCDAVRKIVLKSAETTKRYETPYILILVFVFAIATILVSLAAEDNSAVPRWAPTVVYAIAEVAFIVKSIVMMNPETLQKEFSCRGVENIQPALLRMLSTLCFLRGLLWLVSWILLSLRLANIFDCSYLPLFAPAFISLCLNVISAGTFSQIMESAVNEDTTIILPAIQHMLWHGAGCLCFATSIALVALRFDGTIHVAFTACLAPFLLFFFVMLCCCIYATAMAATMTVDAPTVDHEDFAAVAHKAKPSV